MPAGADIHSAVLSSVKLFCCKCSPAGSVPEHERDEFICLIFIFKLRGIHLIAHRSGQNFRDALAHDHAAAVFSEYFLVRVDITVLIAAAYIAAVTMSA